MVDLGMAFVDNWVMGQAEPTFLWLNKKWVELVSVDPFIR